MSTLREMVAGLEAAHRSTIDDAVAAMRAATVEIGKLQEALDGLIGLVQLLSHNDTIPAELRREMRRNHRYIAACEARGIDP